MTRVWVTDPETDISGTSSPSSSSSSSRVRSLAPAWYRERERERERELQRRVPSCTCIQIDGSIYIEYIEYILTRELSVTENVAGACSVVDNRSHQYTYIDISLGDLSGGQNQNKYPRRVLSRLRICRVGRASTIYYMYSKQRSILSGLQSKRHNVMFCPYFITHSTLELNKIISRNM